MRYAQSLERYIPFKLAMDLPMTEEFISTPGKRAVEAILKETCQILSEIHLLLSWRNLIL
jgi:hypothetical protein